jgi:hypothetical protein
MLPFVALMTRVAALPVALRGVSESGAKFIGDFGCVRDLSLTVFGLVVSLSSVLG